MVIPLTHEALILRKKNKREMTMNNIKNTMCRLSELTKGQVDSLVAAMPKTNYFTFSKAEEFIGFHSSESLAGTWRGVEKHITIVTYTEMMQLLGATDMNKKTAQEQLSAMQVEMDKLKAIINTPEVKTGRVMSADDLERGDLYWCVYGDTQLRTFTECAVDFRRIDAGLVFHDDTSAEKYLEYLKLEQELRIAQAADGKGEGKSVICFRYGGVVCDDRIVSHHKISFNNRNTRNKFRATHTDEQLTLLIRGV
jgi:hypothetical protein